MPPTRGGEGLSHPGRDKLWRETSLDKSETHFLLDREADDLRVGIVENRSHRGAQRRMADFTGVESPNMRGAAPLSPEMSGRAPIQNAKQRRPARPLRPDDSHKLTRPDFEIEVDQRRLRGVFVGETEMFQSDDGRDRRDLRRRGKRGPGAVFQGRIDHATAFAGSSSLILSTLRSGA